MTREQIAEAQRLARAWKPLGRYQLSAEPDCRMQQIAIDKLGQPRVGILETDVMMEMWDQNGDLRAVRKGFEYPDLFVGSPCHPGFNRESIAAYGWQPPRFLQAE